VNEFHGSACMAMVASAADVFEVISDLDRLPEWNRAIERVVERPAALEPGAEWVVVMHPEHLPRWRSRSHVEALEPDRRFVYRSHTDDDNPSFAVWQWDLTPAGDDGVEVTVRWEGHPKTIGRKLLGAPMRSRMLTREVVTSLAAVRARVEAGRPEGDHPPPVG
jgi:uncharacterized protein YndB with AHSA1/START domain